MKRYQIVLLVIFVLLSAGVYFYAHVTAPATEVFTSGSHTNNVDIAASFTPVGLARYMHPDFGVLFSYPSSWGPAFSGGSVHGVPTYFEGTDGFFSLEVLSGQGWSLKEAVAQLAFLQSQPYGESPDLTDMSVDGEEATLIMPREEVLAEAALMVRYPQAIELDGVAYHFFVLTADKAHMKAIAKTVVFFKNDFSEQSLTGVPGIILFSPKEGESVRGALTVMGFARAFENQFSVRVSNASGLLTQVSMMTDAHDAGAFGFFKRDISLPSDVYARVASDPMVTIEALEFSAKDGSEMHKVTSYIRWEPTPLPVPLSNPSVSL